MLYDLWREVARLHRSEIAVTDLPTGDRWTFERLLRTSERTGGEKGSLCCPRSDSIQFILSVLGAWRTGQVLYPLEPGQEPLNLPAPPERIVHLKTTSATTGTAKLAAFTAEQIAADAENIVQSMGLREDRPNLGVISLAHSYGFSSLVTPLLLHGIPLILVGSPLPEVVRNAGAGYGALSLPAVPALWRVWHEAGAIPSAVKLAISAGAPLPLALERLIFEKQGLKLHNFYGATECGGIAYDQGTQPRGESSLIGTPLRNVSLTCAGDGSLEVRGPAVGQTYWPEVSSRLGSGCYRTSDVVDLVRGEVFVRGRLGDQINVAGRKVMPEAIEQALLAHPDVRECLVFGAARPGSERGEMIVACVASRRVVTPGSLRDFLLTRVPNWQLPRDWWFVDTLGMGLRGKLSRAVWRERYLATRSLTPALGQASKIPS